jgi:hypothetical protein
MTASASFPTAMPENLKQPVAASNRGTVITLEYLASAPIVARGTATGVQYQFKGERSRYYVDESDAVQFLRTKLFRRLD